MSTGALTKLEVASALAEHAGFRVFPVEVGGKRPLAGVMWTAEATRDPERIRSWWTAHPGANIGVAAGAYKDGVFLVLDVDGQEGVASLEALEKEHGPLPETFRVKTPGGQHIYLTGGPVPNRVGVASGLDIRSEGGYVVGPFSTRPEGEYTVTQDPEALAAAPEWLVALAGRVTATVKSEDRTPAPGAEIDAPDVIAWAEGYVRDTPPPAEGGRNVALHKLAADFKDRGVSEGTASAMLLPWCGLPEEEAARTVQSAFAGGNRPGCKNPGALVADFEPVEIEPRAGAPEAQAAPVEVFQPQASPPVVPFATTRADLVPLHQEECDLIHGALGHGDMAAVVGASGSGKSFAAFDMAARIATGKPWFGRKVEAGPTVYVAYEGRRRFGRRIAAWRRHSGWNDPLPVYVIHTAAPNFMDARDLERLLAAIREVEAEAQAPVKLIVADTYAMSAVGLDESSAGETGRILRHGAGLIAETGAALLWVHHVGKDKSRGARGSSAFRAALDTELTVTEAASGVRTIRATKNRDGAAEVLGCFQLTPVHLYMGPDGAVGSVAVAEVAASTPVEPVKIPKGTAQLFKLLERLQEEAPTTPEGAAMMVPRKRWREAARDEIYGDKSAPGARQAFGRGVTWLYDRGYIVQSQGAYGIPPERDSVTEA